MNGTKTRIANLLVAGASQAQVARAIGVTESYITQLLTDDTQFNSLYSELMVVKLEKTKTKTDTYDNLELDLVQEMKSRASTADMSELAKALTAVTASRRSNGEGRSSGNSDGVVPIAVNIHLPAFISKQFAVETNSRNEIIEIDGENLQGLTENQFADKLSLLKATKGVQYASTKQKEHRAIGRRLAEIDKVSNL